MKVRINADELYPYYDAVGGKIIDETKCDPREIIEMTEKEYAAYLSAELKWQKWQRIIDERYQANWKD